MRLHEFARSFEPVGALAAGTGPVVALSVSLLAACGGPGVGPAAEPARPAPGPEAVPAPAAAFGEAPALAPAPAGGLEPDGPCLRFDRGRQVGVLGSEALVELSGLVSSRRQPGVLFAHNDSGDRARVFVLATDGRHLGELRLAGVEVMDLEDIALAPGPDRDVLVLGDIGDNTRSRTSVAVLRVPEPEVRAGDPPFTRETDEVEVLRLRYPDGRGHDAETLLVDPVGGDLFILTKELGRPALLFRARAPLPASGGEVVLEAAGEVALGSPAAPVAMPLATGGDVSPAGDAVIVRTYLDVVLWERPAGTSLAEALAGQGFLLPQRFERQGEAVAFAADGRGYFTASEGSRAPLYFFAPALPCR